MPSQNKSAKQHGKQQQHSHSKPKEAIDAANLAVKRRTDSEERGQTRLQAKQTLKCSDWNQTPTDVTVNLFAGKRLSSNDITVDFTEEEVDISLTDGRRWHCKLNRPIKKEQSRVQLAKMKVLLRLKKMTEGQPWTALEFNPDEENEENVPKMKEQPTRQVPGSAPVTRSSTSTRNIPTQERGRRNSPARSHPLGSKSSPNVSLQGDANLNPAQSVSASQSTGDVTTPAPSQAPHAASSLDDTATEGVTEGVTDSNKQEEKSDLETDADVNDGDEDDKKDDSSKEESIFELNHIKHDWHDMTSSHETLTLYIFVKQLDKESVTVTFGEKDIAVAFKTTDPKFLSMHEGTNQDTIFSWKITVVDNLVAEKCKYKLKYSYLELTLLKQEARRWIALEASQDPGNYTGGSTPWMPAVTKPAQNTAKVTPSTDQSKGISDEINEEISRIRPAGGGPDADWSLLEGTREGAAGAELGSSSKAPLQRGNILGESTKDNSQVPKPTCMVSPLSKQDQVDKPQVVRPGMTGLNNLGNTCFMNSVLQVLVNTCELRDYFLDRQFQKDLNLENPLGMGGRLATEFALLSRILWSGKYYHFAPSKLKNLVGSRWTQFTGFAQHDAQEFMAFLLDGLHEDLNRIAEKPYIESKDSNGRPDEVVADEAWGQYKKRNDSMVVDLFQGQYKSKLVCPVCSKVSITFDPFMHLSVPLPKKQTLLSVIFTSKDPFRKPLKYMLRLAKDATVNELKDCMSRKTGVQARDLRVYEVSKHKIYSFVDRGSSLSSIANNHTLVVAEVLSEKVAGEPVVEIYVLQTATIPLTVPGRCSYCKRDCALDSKLKRCTRCYKTAYCDHGCQKRDWQGHRPYCKYVPEVIGQPFIVSLPESQLTYSRLNQMMEAYSRNSVDVFQPPVCQDSDGEPPALEPNNKEDGEAVVSSGDCSQNTRPHSVASSSCSSSSTVTPSCSTDSTLTQTSENSETAESATFSTPVSSSATTVEGTNSTGDFATESDVTPVPSSETAVSEEMAETSFINLPESVVKFSTGDPDSDERESANESQAEDSNGFAPVVSLSENVSASSSKDLTTEKQPEEVEEEGEVKPEKTSPPTRLVYGKQQDLIECVPQFMLKPCDRDGRGLAGLDGKRLEDQGEEPLKLTSPYLAMSWKNNDRSKQYVLVQSKDLVYEEDSSMETALLEENGDITLEHCLSLFTEPEILSPEHAWYCPECKEHREASKQLSIWRLPHTLIIQLKRFSFRNFIWRDKIDKLVTFPLRGLDLSPYFIGSLPSNEPPPIYDLYGVVNHHGGLLGGHYTSYARCPDSSNWDRNKVDWRLFDDSMVSNTTERHVVTRAAYVLFYRRRNHNIDTIAPSVSQSSSSSDEEEEEDMDEDSLEAPVNPPVNPPPVNPPPVNPPPVNLTDSDDYDDDPNQGVEGRNLTSLDNAGSYVNPTPSPVGMYTDMDTVD